MDLSAFFTSEELQTWASQRAATQHLYFVALGLKLLFLSILSFTGLHLGIRRWSENFANWVYARPVLRWLGAKLSVLGRLRKIFERLGSAGTAGEETRRQWLVDASFPVLFLLLYSLLSLPLNYYTGYVREHDLGLANISFAQWWLDWIKSLGLVMLMSAVLGLGLFGLVRKLRRSWWLWLWGAVVGALVLWTMLSPYRARIYHEFSPLADEALRARIETTLTSAGFESAGVEVINSSLRTKKAGAYIMGEGPSKRVILSDNLVAEFHPREIQVAVAHELGHFLLADQAQPFWKTALAALLFLAYCQLVLWAASRRPRLGLKSPADPATLPLLILALQFLFIANAPLSAYLARQEETQADQQALNLTKDPAAFCSLFVRLTRLNQTDPQPPAWSHWYFSHHPSPAERLQAGFDWAEQNYVSLDAQRIPLP